jgi:hypothetical protein
MQTPCAGFSKAGARYRVPGSGYLAPGTRDPVPDQHRGPDTEHRRPSPDPGKRAHRVCKIEMAQIRITWYAGPGTWHPYPIPAFQILGVLEPSGLIRRFHESHTRIIAVWPYCRINLREHISYCLNTTRTR